MGGRLTAPFRDEARPRPVIGGAIGFFGALTNHVFGVPTDAMFRDALATLFRTEPLAGYVLFTVAGAFVYWLLDLFYKQILPHLNLPRFGK